jgi:hypothetical protein
MTHSEGASDPLAAIQGRLDRIDTRFDMMETKLDGVHNSVQWQGEMLKFHGYHFNRLEATLAEHGDMLKAHGDMLKAHGDMLKAHDRRFDQIDATLAEHGHRFGQIDEMLAKILARLDATRP